jgi:tripartite-type tricarboxylate transporter receptor subunit TctC
LAGLNAGVHFLVFAPAATPKSVVAALSADLHKVVGDPALKPRFAAIGFDPTPTSSEEMIEVMRKTSADWTPVVKRLKIRLD